MKTPAYTYIIDGKQYAVISENCVPYADFKNTHQDIELKTVWTPDPLRKRTKGSVPKLSPFSWV